MNTTIVIANDQHLVRKAFVHTLQDRSDFEICAQAADGIEALQKIKFYRPHILLLDLIMPQMDGLQVLEELQRLKSGVKTIIVSQLDKPETIARCMELGACGFLSTYTVDDEEQTAIDSVLATGCYINLQTHRAMLGEIARLRRFEPHLNDNTFVFDHNEMAVLKGYALQLSNEEIADNLPASAAKIDRIKAGMVSALRVDNFLSVFIYALQKGIISIDEIPLRQRRPG